MPVNDVDQTLELVPSLQQHLLHFVANDTGQRLNRQRLAGTLIAGSEVAARRTWAQGVLLHVVTVARLRPRHLVLIESNAEMRGAVHESHERVRIPAHASHAAGDAHELYLIISAAPAVVRKDVVILGLRAAHARAVL